MTIACKAAPHPYEVLSHDLTRASRTWTSFNEILKKQTAAWILEFTERKRSAGPATRPQDHPFFILCWKLDSTHSLF